MHRMRFGMGKNFCSQHFPSFWQPYGLQGVCKVSYTQVSAFMQS